MKSEDQVAFGSMEVLSWLVFLFGVINLINTTLSNQMSRKQENSILRKVVPYKFPVLEMGLFILVLFGMELILSVW